MLIYAKATLKPCENAEGPILEVAKALLAGALQ